MDVQVSWFAILLAVVASVLVGSIWYARGVFGARWMKLVGMTDKKAQEGSLKAILITLAVTAITAYVLAYTTYLSYVFFGHSFLEAALTTAFWLWLGMVAARIITHDAFEQRPMELTALTISNEFFTLMLMGLAIGLVGV